jgi:hypothetical protein
MSLQDRQPLPNAPGTDRITRTANDRLGSVFSALYNFWLARQDAIDSNTRQEGARKDAYSLIFFNHESSTSIENDFTSSPDELLTAALPYMADGGTYFTGALERARYIMNSHWSAERYQNVLEKRICNIYTMHCRTPIVIFLSDGESSIADQPIFDICHAAVLRGFVW